MPKVITKKRLKDIDKLGKDLFYKKFCTNVTQGRVLFFIMVILFFYCMAFFGSIYEYSKVPVSLYQSECTIPTSDSIFISK